MQYGYINKLTISGFMRVHCDLNRRLLHANYCLNELTTYNHSCYSRWYIILVMDYSLKENR